jgi:hypothetical protein
MGRLSRLHLRTGTVVQVAAAALDWDEASGWDRICDQLLHQLSTEVAYCSGYSNLLSGWRSNSDPSIMMAVSSRIGDGLSVHAFAGAQ